MPVAASSSSFCGSGVISGVRRRACRTRDGMRIEGDGERIARRARGRGR